MKEQKGFKKSYCMADLLTSFCYLESRLQLTCRYLLRVWKRVPYEQNSTMHCKYCATYFFRYVRLRQFCIHWVRQEYMLSDYLFFLINGLVIQSFRCKIWSVCELFVVLISENIEAQRVYSGFWNTNLIKAACPCKHGNGLNKR